MKRPLKYRNVPTEVDGVLYSSKAEARRAQELALLQRAGKISHLRRQPRFPIEINGHKVATYVGDFVYLENGKETVEDVKGVLTDVFRIKRALMKAVLGIDVKVVP
jgi:hypothetical protein